MDTSPQRNSETKFDGLQQSAPRIRDQPGSQEEETPVVNNISEDNKVLTLADVLLSFEKQTGFIIQSVNSGNQQMVLRIDNFIASSMADMNNVKEDHQNLAILHHELRTDHDDLRQKVEQLEKVVQSQKTDVQKMAKSQESRQ